MLAPLVKRRLAALKDPELSHILMLGGEFENSLEMTARRMVELGEYACAIVFSTDKTVLEQTVVQDDGFKVTLLSYDPE